MIAVMMMWKLGGLDNNDSERSWRYRVLMASFLVLVE